MNKDKFKIANKLLKSRLIVGTGKYKNFSETAKAIQSFRRRYGDRGSEKNKHIR